MPEPEAISVTVTKVIEARPETIYDLVADITAMGAYSPENTGGTWLGGATGPVVGARFKGTNRLGKATWSTKPTITAATRGRRFAFKVPGGAGPQWTYLFDVVDGGTRVTESMVQAKPSPAIIRFIQRRNGVADRAANLRDSMTITLYRLSVAATLAERELANV